MIRPLECGACDPQASSRRGALTRLTAFVMPGGMISPAIPTHWTLLEQLAKNALADLAIIEAETFAFDIEAGRIRPKDPTYWDLDPGGTTSVFLRGF